MTRTRSKARSISPQGKNCVVAAGEIGLAANPRLQRGTDEVAAILALAEEYDHPCARLPQLAELVRQVDRVLGEAHDRAERQHGLRARSPSPRCSHSPQARLPEAHHSRMSSYLAVTW